MGTTTTTTTMKMKTSELSGPALDWAVAKCEGHVRGFDEGAEVSGLPMKVWHWHPTENWSQGGPIIERERMLIRPTPQRLWEAWKHGADDPCFSVGPTPLIAAMRCYVASKLGNEVGIPEGIA